METYKAARERILSELKARGYDVRTGLKIPWVKVPSKNYGVVQVWFRTQAVYLEQHSMFVDIRGVSTDMFLEEIQRI